MAEERSQRMMYAFSCYLEKRRDKPQGDVSNAIAALYELNSGEDSTPPKSTPPKSTPPRRHIHREGGPQLEPRSSVEPRDVIDARDVPAPSPAEPSAAPATPREIPSATSDTYVDTVQHEPGPAPVQISETRAAAEAPRRRGRCDSCGLSLRKGEAGVCNSCGINICLSCGEYPHLHKDSPIFFEYRFDFPLCKDCYVSAFKTQEEMGRASTYFRTGNFTYASRHARRAVDLSKSWEGGDVYQEKAMELMSSVDGYRPRGDVKGRMKQSEGRKREPLDDLKGDKWARRFVERALSRKED